ncbi:MAG: amidohydrolase [Ponticaulis sp.]|nr:amidohydrolase [Ponticaulis sp.]
MTERLKLACVQMTTRIAPTDNLPVFERLVRQAAADGAIFVATPEMTGFMDIRPGGTARNVQSESNDIILTRAIELARELKITLMIGSLAIKLDDESRSANRSFLISPHGQILARYDKMHMFDVEVDDGQSYRESKAYKPGDQFAVADTDFGKIGMSICYDLRFPYLYRAMAMAGADIFTCPAAFTYVTGKAHWHVLLRARAIENGSFVIAPAQAGQHEDGRRTFGHSLIIAPWGEILAEGPEEGEAVITSEIDLSAVHEARRRVPSLQHTRDISS